MSFLNFKRTLNTSCLGKTHQPPGFPIFGNWTWCPYSDLVALMAYQLGVGYATNLGCCEAPESEHDGGSYQNPAINGLFSRGWAFGRTDVTIPTSPLQRIWPAWSLNHLSAKCLWNWIICRGETEKNTGVRSYFPVLLGEWEIFPCHLPVPCVFVSKCCDSWTAEGLRMAAQYIPFPWAKAFSRPSCHQTEDGLKIVSGLWPFDRNWLCAPLPIPTMRYLG